MLQSGEAREFGLCFQHTTTNLLYRFCEITSAVLWEMELYFSAGPQLLIIQ